MSINFDNAIWLAGMVTQLLVIGLLTYRRVWRTLPVFCSYLIWDISSNLALYGIARYHPAKYFQVYFADTAIDAAFVFCVLVELAWSVLRPMRASLSRGALVIVGILILVAGVAVWPFTALPGLVHATSHQGQLLTQLMQTVAILRILFFLLLAGGSQLLSISWRDRELQVATGFGIYAFVSLTAAVLDLHQTTAIPLQHIAQFVAASYDCCLIYWVVSFAQQEAARREFTPQMQSFLLAVAGAARTTRIGLEETHGSKSRKPDGR
jgi:hypothetical protein